MNGSIRATITINRGIKPLLQLKTTIPSFQILSILCIHVPFLLQVVDLSIKIKITIKIKIEGQPCHPWFPPSPSFLIRALGRFPLCAL